MNSDVHLSRDEAQVSLETIARIQRQTRRTVAHGGGPWHMMVWGTIWFLGFLANQFLTPEQAGMIWTIMAGLGMIASFVIGWWYSKKMRRPLQDARIGLFWLAWFVNSSVIVYLTKAYQDATVLNLTIAVLAMFGYVVMGLWLWQPLAWVGIAVTIIATLAYTWMPEYVNLIMALLGGGTLFFSGLYIYRSWR